MQTTSALFKSLWGKVNTTVETKAVINGEDYLHDRIFSASVSLEMFSEGTACAGSAVSRELTLVLRDVGAIPKSAEIQMFIRLVNGNTVSEWIPKGVYYIDTREQQYGLDRLEIHGYDVIRKADKTFTSSGDQGYWPMTDIDVVEEIAERIGAKSVNGSRIDPRTIAILTKRYQVQYPGYGDGAYTMRECLGFIGAMYAGNWITNDFGQLRLVMLGDIPTETNLLIDENADYIKLGNDRILIVTGLAEPHRMVIETGETLKIGGDTLLV